MARVPIVRIGDVLVATVLDEIRDRDAIALQTDLGDLIERFDVRGVLLDLSTVYTIDSFLGRVLNEVGVIIRLLGSRMVIVGIQPAVAITLVELGLELPGVPTAVDADRGRAVLRRLIAADERSTPDGPH